MINLRKFYFLNIFLILVGLTACVPTPAISTEATIEPVTTAWSVERLTGTPPAVLNITEEVAPEENSDELLVVPTLAPTATPGVINNVVERTVRAANLDTTRFLGLFVADWINLVIAILLVILSLNLISRLAFYLLKKITRRTATPYDEIYLLSIKPYLQWLFGVLGMYIATAWLQFLSPSFKQWLGQVYYTVVVVLVVIGLWKLVDIFVLWYQNTVTDQDGRSSKEAALLLGERTLRTLLVLIGAIIILDHVGFNISALLTAIGIGGLALSLAAQETIANMISGVIILIDQPFRTGDRIEIQELNTWGDVVSIGLRSTRIRTLDNRLVIVPNARISNNQVVNYTFPDPRYRIQTQIGVAYGTDLRIVRDVITKALKEVEGVLPDKPVDVLFLEWGDSVMVLRVRWWIESYLDARRSIDRVNECIYQTLDKAGVETPHPTMIVELKEMRPVGISKNPGIGMDDHQLPG